MLLVTSNQSKQLLCLSFIGTVRPDEFPNGRADVAAQLTGLSPGFRYLVDLTQLESMSEACLAELGRMMELISRAGVGLVVRVIPDPSKDIGMNILAVFHYPHGLSFVTCKNFAEAAQALGL